MDQLGNGFCLSFSLIFFLFFFTSRSRRYRMENRIFIASAARFLVFELPLQGNGEVQQWPPPKRETSPVYLHLQPLSEPRRCIDQGSGTEDVPNKQSSLANTPGTDNEPLEISSLSNNLISLASQSATHNNLCPFFSADQSS